MAGALARAADYHNVPWVARKELATRVFLVTSHGGAASFAAPSSSAAMRAASSPIAAVTRPLPRREGLLDLFGRRCAPTSCAVLPLCPKLVTWRERAVGSKSRSKCVVFPASLGRFVKPVLQSADWGAGRAACAVSWALHSRRRRDIAPGRRNAWRVVGTAARKGNPYINWALGA